MPNKPLVLALCGGAMAMLLVAAVGWLLFAQSTIPTKAPSSTAAANAPATTEPTSAFGCANATKPPTEASQRDLRVVNNDFLCLSFEQPIEWINLLGKPHLDEPRGIDFGAPDPVTGKNYAFARLTPITDESQIERVTGFRRDMLEGAADDAGYEPRTLDGGGTVRETYSQTGDGLFYGQPYWIHTYYLVDFTAPKRTYVLTVSRLSTDTANDKRGVMLDLVQKAQPY